jgi:cytoskeleton protein RodZ
MINETHQPNTADQVSPTVTFGIRLKAAREAQGLELRDVAAQLRLHEKIIIMMEKDRYPADLPVTFIRGYLRAYSKLLQIPECEVKEAIEPIKPKPMLQDANLVMKPKTTEPVVTSSNYFMQFFTLLIVLTLAGLVATWWYNHNTALTTTVENPLIETTTPQTESNAALNSPAALTAATTATPSTMTAPATTEVAKATTQTQQAAVATTPTIGQTDVEDKLTSETAAVRGATTHARADASHATQRHVVPVVDADDNEPDGADGDQTD